MDEDESPGPTDEGYRLLSAILVVVSIVTWIGFVNEAGDAYGDPEVWLTFAIVTTVWSATCAVLCCLKNLEHTLGSQAVRPRDDSSPDA